MNNIEKTSTNNTSTLAILNTPNDLDLSIFGNINQTKNIHKLIFLIHQINKYTSTDGVFRMHKKTYYEFLGLSPKDLNKYLNILIDAGLIKQTQVGNNITEKLSEFEFLKPFEPSTGVKHTYYPSKDKCPLFIRKWVSDNFAVHGKDKTNYTKPVKAVKPERVSKVDANVYAELAALRAKVLELEAENAALKQLQTIQPVIVAPVEDSLLNNDDDLVDDDLDTYLENLLPNSKVEPSSTLPISKVTEPEIITVQTIYGDVEIRNVSETVALVESHGGTKDELINSVTNYYKEIYKTDLKLKVKWDFKTMTDYVEVIAA